MGCQELNIFLSLERNPSLFSSASGLSPPASALAVALPPGHKQQRAAVRHTSQQQPAPLMKREG